MSLSDEEIAANRAPGEVDPEIWKNPTLGSVGAGPFLNEIEKQSQEDYNARREGREPKVVEYVKRYPQMMPSGTIPSVQDEFVFLDPGDVSNEQPNPPVAEEPTVPDSGTENTNSTGLPTFNE